MRVDPRLELCSLFVVAVFPVAAQTPGFQSSGGNTTTSDKVGIGTTDPVSQLNVVTQSTGLPRGVTVDQYASDGNGALISFRKARGTPSAPSALLGNDTLGSVLAFGYDGSAFTSSSRIRFLVDGTVAAGSVPTAIQFLTGANNNGIERMRVTSGGNVGIGTSSPTLPLQILGVAQLNGAVARRNVTAFDASASAAGVGGGIAFGGSYSTAGATSEFGHIWGIKESAADNNNAGALLFATHGNATDPVERMRIGSDGLITVGTNPAPPAGTVKLNVIGDINVTGNINAKYQDVAEWVPGSTSMTPGTVVVLDRETSNQVMPSSSSYDTAVAGVVSGQPGLLLGEPGFLKSKIATTGRVKVRVDASRSPVHIGDLLVTSDERGLAMRSEPMNINGRRFHQPGTIIGKALEPLKEGKGEILVLLSLQ